MFGAHPDDTDIKCGGVAALYRAKNHIVKMVSITDGGAGHQTGFGPPLVARRRLEAEKAGKVLGIEYLTLDNPDGALVASLVTRDQLISIIRRFKPDLIMIHRPNDYHPDHRAASQLVQDASYLLTVPAIVPEVAHLSTMPVIVYLHDNFQKPAPFAPDVVIGIDAVIEKKFDALHQHTSQVYEWLPFNHGHLGDVPNSDDARKKWLREQWDGIFRAPAQKFRKNLIALYGKKRGEKFSYAEVFELCEYGAKTSTEGVLKLFPFFNA